MRRKRIIKVGAFNDLLHWRDSIITDWIRPKLLLYKSFNGL